MIAAVVPLRGRRDPHATAAESHMEAAEAARRLLAFTEDELRASFRSGDLNRLRNLQRVHHDAKTILAEHRRQAAWHDAACYGERDQPGHGRAA